LQYSGEKRAAYKASCWSLVAKLLKVLFKEIHKVRVEAAGLKNICDNAARVNGSFLYAALEELRVLREFQDHKYCQHPKFHHNVVMHLSDTPLPHPVYESCMDGAGCDTLKLTWLKNAVSDQRTSIDRLETAFGMMHQGLGLPAAVLRRKCGGANKGVTLAEGVDVIE
jgi:hypothetical protein